MLDEQKQSDIVQNLCMIAFYIIQTEETNPTIAEVEEYFNKLLTSPIEEDILCYAIFERQYMQAMNNKH